MQRRRVFPLPATAALVWGRSLTSKSHGGSIAVFPVSRRLGHQGFGAHADHPGRKYPQNSAHRIHNRRWFIDGITPHVRQSGLPVFQG